MYRSWHSLFTTLIQPTKPTNYVDRLAHNRIWEERLFGVKHEIKSARQMNRLRLPPLEPSNTTENHPSLTAKWYLYRTCRDVSSTIEEESYRRSASQRSCKRKQGLKGMRNTNVVKGGKRQLGSLPGTESPASVFGTRKGVAVRTLEVWVLS